MHADDVKIYFSYNTPFDSSLLQEDLDRFAKWCDMNCMQLNYGFILQTVESFTVPGILMHIYRYETIAYFFC